MVVKHDGTAPGVRAARSSSAACSRRARSGRCRRASSRRSSTPAETMLHEREDREISTQEIGAFVMERLRELDQVAYVRFASVYRRFEDIGAFMDVLKTLLQPHARPHRPEE